MDTYDRQCICDAVKWWPSSRSHMMAGTIQQDCSRQFKCYLHADFHASECMLLHLLHCHSSSNSRLCETPHYIKLYAPIEIVLDALLMSSEKNYKKATMLQTLNRQDHAVHKSFVSPRAPTIGCVKFPHPR